MNSTKGLSAARVIRLFAVIAALTTIITAIIFPSALVGVAITFPGVLITTIVSLLASITFSSGGIIAAVILLAFITFPKAVISAIIIFWVPMMIGLRMRANRLENVTHVEDTSTVGANIKLSRPVIWVSFLVITLLGTGIGSIISVVIDTNTLVGGVIGAVIVADTLIVLGMINEPTGSREGPAVIITGIIISTAIAAIIGAIASGIISTIIGS